ncbi:MAG: hypothetical protein KKB70_07165 [Proteobacteria bacterium]|nr:hypothetical protein [Pseudomonadota bacterium]MBU1612673.1 hypothetical protein [Pseudomonadota bacterium]
MNTILLAENGSILQAGKLIETAVLRRFSSAVQLEEDYRLRSFFRMAQRYPQLQEVSEFFSSFMERYNGAAEKGCTTSEVERLELSRVVEMIGFPGTPRMDIYTSLHGIRKEKQQEIRFIQIEDLLDMPLKLGRLKHIVLGDSTDVFEFDTVFTLFEFIEGITWELSFHGTPSQCKLGR